MLNAIENFETPADLEIALKQLTNASAYWGAFPRSAKRGILEWIAQAKTQATRAKRVAEMARLANEYLCANRGMPKTKP
jgi:uncharacterized protein YdeI (YjbR/CyaY-like superfamily)